MQKYAVEPEYVAETILYPHTLGSYVFTATYLQLYWLFWPELFFWVIVKSVN